MQTDHSARVTGRRGVALVIVLAFVVLLTGLVIAFFSRSILDRQISNSSVSRAKVNNFADGAADAIIGELKQEIVLGSATNTITTGNVTNTVYTPLAPAYMLPQISGTSGITASGLQYPYNLLKVSSPGQLFYSGSNGTIPSSGNNVVAVSSTTPSLNGRYLTPAYWNQHYLLPTTSSTDSTPATNSFVPPSWILVARDSSNPTQWNSNMVASSSNLSSVVGRYAFAIYHEGGLLDVNAAGYPSTSGTYSVYKNALPYADLTQVCTAAGIPSATATNIVDSLVAWRNYASIPSPNPFPSPGFTLASASNYYSLVVSNTNGYLNVSGTAMNNGQTDRMFASRQELIKFAQDVWGFGPNSNNTYLNVLNYLTTFTRDLNQPSYIPPVQSSTSAPVVLAASLGGNSAYGGDTQINPSFPTVRVQTSFTRDDGSTANVGDPLVNKRFALQRLAWITYKGPSGGGNGFSPRNQTDPDIQALINDGIPWSYLQLGTAANIQNYFGLNWDAQNNRWNYSVHNGGGTGKGLIMLVGRPAGTSPDSTKYVQDANRDPDFFELLKAGITVGSLGKAAITSTNSVSSTAVPKGYAAVQVPVNERYPFDSSVDYHIIQLGANILNEVNPTSYPVRITFDDGTARGAWEFQGVTDLPYLSYVFNGVLRTQAPSPAPAGGTADTSPHQYPYAAPGTLTQSGTADMIQVPAVWDPYDPNGTAGVLRPTLFRILVDSNDPVSLYKGQPDVAIWTGAWASTSTTGQGTDNEGVEIPANKVNSWGTATMPPGGNPVSDSVTFNDNNGALYREPTLIFGTTAPGNATRPGGDITNIDANPLPNEADNSTGPWAPLVLGQFPLAFTSGSNICYPGVGLIGLLSGNGDNRVYFTYRVQYQDPNNASNWITYDTKYGRTTYGQFSFQNGGPYSPTVIRGPDRFSPYSWASAIDPRTARFGLITDTVSQGRPPFGTTTPIAPVDSNNSNNPWIYNSGGATMTVGITYPIRRDNTQACYFENLDETNLPPGSSNAGNDGLMALTTQDIPYPSFSAGWTAAAATINNHTSSNVWMFAPGMYEQNNPSAPFYDGSLVQPSYYADADGVVRRAAGAYVPATGVLSASTPVGLPAASIQGWSNPNSSTLNPPSSLIYPASMASPQASTHFAQSQSRPLLLHRPFRSVAELGYVFRDVPWKNLDFFTPESGDASLLDIFCINETGSPTSLVAGKVNLNTRQAPVLAAIVSGAYVDDPKISDATVGSLSGTLAASIGTTLTTRTTNTAASNGPLQNISELVGKWNSAIACSSGVTYSPSGTNWGTELGSPYVDGQKSYTGFSGNLTASTTGKDLNATFTPITSGAIMESLAYVKRFREAPVRALANAGQTRVWNLLIDVVAQTGRYPSSAASATNPLAAFNVEGQQHYWVHIAIDRPTGQVLDKQIEVVKE
jgi:hypothetical protein